MDTNEHGVEERGTANGERNSFAPRLSGWKANLFVVFLGLLPFILLEAGLWLAGYESHAYYENTSRHVPVFRRVGSRVEVTPERSRQLKTRPFKAVKEPGTVRIMAVGDSVTAGFMSLPEKNVFSFETRCYPVVLESLLNARHPGRRAEVINCGACGYGTYRLKDVLTEALQYDPDLVTIHCGSSEFLEARHFKNWHGVRASLASKGILHWKTLALVRDLARRARSSREKASSPGESPDGISPSLPWIKQDMVKGADEVRAVLDHSRRNVRAMIRSCKEAGVPVILCTSPSNLRVNSLAGDLAGNPQFASLFRAAMEHMKRSDFRGVLDLLGAELDNYKDDYMYGSRIHFLAGEAYSGLGDYEKAYPCYALAVDLDPEVIRATRAFNDMLIQVAEEEGVPLVDLVTAFRKIVPDGVPDKRLFWDNCHFRVPAHEHTARLLIEAIPAGVFPQP